MSLDPRGPLLELPGRPTFQPGPTPPAAAPELVAGSTPAAEPAALWLARLVLAAALVWSASLLVSRADYVPMWDGRIYADCVIAAARDLSPGALRCAAHPSHAYAAVLALVQRLAPGSFPLLLATNAALLLVGAAALGALLRRTFPAPSLAPERTLVLAAFLAHPVVLANVVQPGLDFGVLVFFLAATAAAVAHRPWPMVLFGTMAAFSKETGVLLYSALVAIHVLLRFLPRPIPRDLALAVAASLLLLLSVGFILPGLKVGLLIGAVVAGAAFLVMRPRDLPPAYRRPALVPVLVRALRSSALLALPVVLFAGYLLYRKTVPQNEAVLWGGERGGSVLRALVTPQFGATVRSYLALLLVLGFLWVLTLPVLADLGLGVRRFVRRLPRRPLPGGDPEVVLFVSWLTIAVVYLLTRYVTFANSRYLLPAYPLMLLLGLAALVRLGVGARWRVAGLTGVVALLGISAVRTADPVSRALWGTFRVGRHEMLRITSLTGECCGSGRDQLTYNLQFTAFDHLTHAALAAIQPVARRRALSATFEADWHLVGPLDLASRRTLATIDSLPSTTFAPEHPAAAQAPADSLWHLAYPFTSSAASLAASRRAGYDLVRVDTVRADGYAMPVLLLVRRTMTSAPSGG